MAAIVKNRLSVAEYLELESQSAVKHEYYDGELTEMPGTSRNHDKIVSQLRKLIDNAVDEKGYVLYSSDVKIQLEAEKWFVYSDLSVCNDEQETNELFVENPIIVFEVLSQSTQNYDRTKKYKGYAAIPSVKQIVLIAQEFYSIESFVRNSTGRFELDFLDQPADLLTLPALGLSITLEEIYRKVQF